MEEGKRGGGEVMKFNEKLLQQRKQSARLALDRAGKHDNASAFAEAARDASSWVRVTESLAAVAAMRVAFNPRQIETMMEKGSEEREAIC